MSNQIHWYSEKAKNSPSGAVIFLPGRSNYGYNLLRTYTRAFDWKDVHLTAVTPPLHQGWYPPPFSPAEQSESVKGLDAAAKAINNIISRVCLETKLPRSKIVISGFSMGAVAAIHWATHTRNPVGAVISHSGAILEPWKIPESRHDMPIILNHGQDDYCFDWEERFLPMKRSLIENNYNIWLAERAIGGHQVNLNDVIRCRETFVKIFDVDIDWKPIWASEVD